MKFFIGPLIAVFAILFSLIVNFFFESSTHLAY